MSAAAAKKQKFVANACKLYDMQNVTTNIRVLKYDYFLTGGDRQLIDIIADNPTEDNILQMLRGAPFSNKIEDYIDGEVEKIIVLHVLKRSAADGGYFPRLHTDYDRSKGIKEGCIEMCTQLKDSDHNYMPEIEKIRDGLDDTDDDKLYPLNLWSLLSCSGESLGNDNLYFYSPANYRNDQEEPKYSTYGVSYLLKPEPTSVINLHTYDNLPSDGSGYLFNSREIPHCSINLPDRGGSDRESIEIRIMIVKR